MVKISIAPTGKEAIIVADGPFHHQIHHQELAIYFSTMTCSDNVDGFFTYMYFIYNAVISLSQGITSLLIALKRLPMKRVMF
jgi:hypothetical protein